jgi:hypothetical protein
LFIIEDRYGRRSTSITSQLTVLPWHEVIGNPTYADAILYLRVYKAHRIFLSGQRLRRNKRLKILTPADDQLTTIKTGKNPASRGEIVPETGRTIILETMSGFIGNAINCIGKQTFFVE